MWSQHLHRLRRTLPLLLVLAGVLVYFEVLSPRAPKEHIVFFEFADSTDDVTRLEALWTEVGSEEPVAGSTLPFVKGSAPRKVRTQVRTPDGEYWVDLRVERGSRITSFRRKVLLDSDETTVFLRGMAE